MVSRVPLVQIMTDIVSVGSPQVQIVTDAGPKQPFGCLEEGTRGRWWRWERGGTSCYEVERSCIKDLTGNSLSPHIYTTTE